MRKLMLLCLALFLTLPLASAASAAQTQTIGGRWLAKGGGFAEKSILRIEMDANGYIDIKSTNTDGVERITGYDVYSVLRATELNIEAWDYRGSQTLAVPVPIENYNPTLSNPITLPTFTSGGLSYTVVLTSTTSGTVRIRGYADIDTAGRCEINADCALWKEGTPMPAIPDTESGCNTGAGALAAAALAFSLSSRFFHHLTLPFPRRGSKMSPNSPR